MNRSTRLFELQPAMLRPAFYLVVAFVATPSLPAEDVLFERDVRPILKAHCFHCHGEAGEKESGLDLRLRRLIVEGGESGEAVVPGKPDESLLLDYIQSGEMPPGNDKNLPEKEIRIIESWIASGAKTAREEPIEIGDGPIYTEEERDYWAFQPVKRPEIPKPVEASRIRTPIDAFLLAHETSFAADADRERLIRRAYFDMIGLPPALAAVDRFIDDSRPESWDLLIEELLASPHYGERWGRHWLDVAGYADSEGYTDEDRVRPNAWRYRDYVIQSFNADKPFDIFVQEQLAGDELVPRPHKNLPDDAIQKLTATGFLRMAPDGTATSGIDKALAQNQVIADTLQIVGSSLLGMTVNCAQCHDHRYDPISTADYYRLRAIFEPAFDWKHWKVPAGRQISLYTDEDRQQAAEVEKEAVAVDSERKTRAAKYITRTLEEELLLVPENIRNDLRTAYQTTGKDRDETQKALLKEYPSVASISEGSLYLFDRRRDADARKLDAERAKKLKQFITDASSTAGEKVTEKNLGTFAPDAAAELQQLADKAKALRDSKAAPDLKKLTEQAAKIRERKPVEGFVRALAEAADTTPATFVYYRGDHEQPKAEVSPGDLTILGENGSVPENDETLPTTGRRLAYAKWLTNGNHPLLARVIVNRIWLHHFGRGLVDSPGNFGMLGSRPTHPRLLDWLAAEFVDSGWSVKHMHRLMMRSTVYRQAAANGGAGEPRQYSSYPIRRLESEVLRDAVLTVSGLLNKKQFGEPVPVMEDAVGQIIIGKEMLDGERKPTKAISMEGEEYRRSVYIQVRRTRTLSMFETFDAPIVSPNCEKRSFSTATPQSLLMMNSMFSLTYAEAFAGRIIRESDGSNEARITMAWRLAFGIRPTDTEVLQAKEFISDLKKQLQEKDGNLVEDELQKTAYGVFCQALLSSNRFLYVE